MPESDNDSHKCITGAHRGYGHTKLLNKICWTYRIKKKLLENKKNKVENTRNTQ